MKAEHTDDQATAAEPAVTPLRSETVTYPQWGRIPPAEDEAISLHQVLLAEFHGDRPEPVSAEHLHRLEEWLRSHAVGGSTRKPEGWYGQKTRDLIEAAYRHYLGRPSPDGRPGADLWEALRVAGAPVTG